MTTNRFVAKNHPSVCESGEMLLWLTQQFLEVDREIHDLKSKNMLKSYMTSNAVEFHEMLLLSTEDRV